MKDVVSKSKHQAVKAPSKASAAANTKPRAINNASLSVLVNARPPAGKLPAKAAKLQHISWDSMPVESLSPLLSRHFIVGKNIMVARVLIKKGGKVPEHSHYNEQVTYVLEGALKFWIEGKEIVVNAGEVLTIPPHMPHRAEALADTVDLDIFTPPREDWMARTDRYLRPNK